MRPATARRQSALDQSAHDVKIGPDEVFADHTEASITDGSFYHESRHFARISARS
jgi:hypothetical protein